MEGEGLQSKLVSNCVLMVCVCYQSYAASLTQPGLAHFNVVMVSLQDIYFSHTLVFLTVSFIIFENKSGIACLYDTVLFSAWRHLITLRKKKELHSLATMPNFNQSQSFISFRLKIRLMHVSNSCCRPFTQLWGGPGH